MNFDKTLVHKIFIRSTVYLIKISSSETYVNIKIKKNKNGAKVLNKKAI